MAARKVGATPRIASTTTWATTAPVWTGHCQQGGEPLRTAGKCLPQPGRDQVQAKTISSNLPSVRLHGVKGKQEMTL